ncbi:hypothetical protein P3T37_006850 [Kitasatospora sp. MAA4]|uniref:hypothetical protein n=1 Tax=Kitasatospora sp. MAA4 TaxID=3035093 RepID=UPI002473714B|nr:hypothetical protein [Kitasatospora sp. MAA4]MDH6137418.1 hypothetical protein [Kitasatospora sp. MAA4]
MTIRTYRLTTAGERVEVSWSEVVEADWAPHDPLNWPSCRCPRHRTESDEQDTG